MAISATSSKFKELILKQTNNKKKHILNPIQNIDSSENFERKLAETFTLLNCGSL